MTPVQEIVGLFETAGARAYLGEPVTQLQHALQAARLAVHEQAPPSLICAALLHDIGHLLAGAAEDTPSQDLLHESLGSEWLKERFPEAVSSPVRLHVAAKRYLCTVEPAYLACLSEASLHSLHLQGGLMSDAEVAAFTAEPFHADAVALRRWDDAAKDPSLPVPPLGEYEELLRRLCGPSR
jgi:gamma-butyrobetaine dioxygenase